MGEPQRIVIVLPTWVGDAVMATPALRAVRRAFPQAYIAWYAGRLARDVLAGLPWADAVLPAVRKPRGLGGTVKGARLLAAEHFDTAVLLSNSFRSALLCRLGRCGRLVGYGRDGRGWLLSDRLRAPRDGQGRFVPTPALTYYLRLAEVLGAGVSDRRMELAVEPEYEQEADSLFARMGLAPDRPIVVLNPGAHFGSSKLWPAERFAAVADALRERHGAQIIVNAAPSEQEIAAAVAVAMRQPPEITFSQIENTLGLLKAITSRCSLVVTGDTGPRHVAAALGVPVVTIFGSTDPRWTEIDCPRERIVRVDVPCGPCQQKVCPLPAGAEHHQCMTRISPEMVLQAAGELLAATQGQA